jgi:hypothetical protein
MPNLADLVNDLIALIPEDGSRITNDEIRAALEREAGEYISDEELKELKSQVVALGAAEGVKGPGGGLRAPGSTPAYANCRSSRRLPQTPQRQRHHPGHAQLHHRPRHHGRLGAHR